MQQDIQGQVLQVTGKPTRNGGTKFDIAFSDGNSYSTFDGALANKANGLSGQQVSARLEQKGQYWNLVDIAPLGQLIPLAGTTIPVQNGAGAIPIQMSPPSGGGRGGMDPAREAKIVKQNVLGTAFGAVFSLYQGAGPEAFEEAKAKALELAQGLYGVVMGAVAPSQPAPVVPVAQTPEAVAAAVNEAAGQPLVGVGADQGAEASVIPWAT